MRIDTPSSFLKHLKKCPQDFFVIHYSCKGFALEITSIAVANYNNEQISSFSTHAIAAELQIEHKDIRDNFDKIELELLDRFYEFAREHKDKFWVHWNMKSQNYGFEHLEHRYRALAGKNAVKIPAEQRINLDKMLKFRYGEKYVDTPSMLSLMEINWGRHRDFLEGKEEPEAFEKNNFASMHQSTLIKVEFFCWVIKKMSKGRLKTNSRKLGVMLDRMFESRIMKFIGLLGALVSIISALFLLL